MKLWWIICLSFSITWSSSSQSLTNDQVEVINDEIHFINEAIHRMVIVFQVFENYNSEISKHVDLPSNEGIKNTSAHLPGNLFSDTTFWDKGGSPLELFEALRENPSDNGLSIDTWALVSEVRTVIESLNEDRTVLDSIIQNEDLTTFANIQTIYAEIEEAVASFDRVRSSVKMFEKVLLESYHDLQMDGSRRQVYTALIELHYDIKKIVRQLRNENQSGVFNSLSKLEKEFNWLGACINQLSDANERQELNQVVGIMEELVSVIQGYVRGEPVPDVYLPFGTSYYYHNYSILPKLNKYGSGYVWKLEAFFEKFEWNVLHFFEEPHYLKIIYPELIPLEVMKSGQMDPETNIREIEQELPRLASLVVEKTSIPVSEPTLDQPEIDEGTSKDISEEERPLIIAFTETIRVDTAHFELLLFDHYSADGDRVSINVNGEWVHQRISLERASRKLKLSVLPGEANSVIIRADNEGWRTPNTIGIKYKSKLTENNVFLRRDLETYEAIQLKFVM